MRSRKELKIEIPTNGYQHLSENDRSRISRILIENIDDLVIRFDENNVDISIIIEAKGCC